MYFSFIFVKKSIESCSFQEHLYSLPDPRELKRRLDGASETVQSLQKQARNTVRREKRLRATLHSTLEELRDNAMVTAELKAQLAVYSGKWKGFMIFDQELNGCCSFLVSFCPTA